MTLKMFFSTCNIKWAYHTQQVDFDYEYMSIVIEKENINIDMIKRTL